MTNDELFTRLYYQGTVQLGMQPEQFWLTPFGLFLDLRECHWQFHGITKPLRSNNASAAPGDIIGFQEEL